MMLWIPCTSISRSSVLLHITFHSHGTAGAFLVGGGRIKCMVAQVDSGRADNDSCRQMWLSFPPTIWLNRLSARHRTAGTAAGAGRGGGVCAELETGAKNKNPGAIAMVSGVVFTGSKNIQQY